MNELLAFKLRPKKLDEVVGQQHPSLTLVTKNYVLGLINPSFFKFYSCVLHVYYGIMYLYER